MIGDYKVNVTPEQTKQWEREALLSDAKQTAVFLDESAKLLPKLPLLWQAANVIRGLVEAIENAKP